MIVGMFLQMPIEKDIHTVQTFLPAIEPFEARKQIFGST